MIMGTDGLPYFLVDLLLPSVGNAVSLSHHVVLVFYSSNGSHSILDLVLTPV